MYRIYEFESDLISQSNRDFAYSGVDDGEVSAFDCQSSSIIKLNNATILYLREVNKYLALVGILREDSFERQGECSTVSFYAVQTCQTVPNLLSAAVGYNRIGGFRGRAPLFLAKQCLV